MAIAEILKGNALALVAGNAGAGQSSEYVTMDIFRQVLYEMFGAGQSGLVLPTGALGSAFPAGETLTGTVIGQGRLMLRLRQALRRLQRT
jgi:hypothetical protein